VGAGDLFENGKRTITGLVIQSDDFKRRVILFQNRLDTFTDVFFFIARRYEDGDSREINGLFRFTGSVEDQDIAQDDHQDNQLKINEANDYPMC
jgi:hypothetical protein